MELSVFGHPSTKLYLHNRILISVPGITASEETKRNSQHRAYNRWINHIYDQYLSENLNVTCPMTQCPAVDTASILKE